MKHTALPWKFKPIVCDDDRGMGWIVGGDTVDISHHGVSERWKEENLANAAFIVRACNNHAKLLEVLKEAYACLGVLEYAPGRLLGKMDKAIREAEE